MSLLRMSLSGAVIILAVTVIRAIAIHRLSKKVFLAFWWIAVVRLLMPISFPLLLSRRVFTNQRALVADSVEKCISGFEKEAAQVLHVNTPAISALQIIWIVGAVLCFGYFSLCYLRCRREFAASLPVQNDFVQKWLSEHPLRRAIDVRSLTGLSTPLTYGLFHPVILMPKNTDWENDSQLRYILFHEYVHICHFDVVSKLIVAVTVCVHWFNPMVWVLYILFNRDIELACDECVIRRFGGNDRASYARVLICMEETRHIFSPFYNYFAKNAIEERIESIMRFRKKSVSALAFALVFVAMVTGTAFAATEAREIRNSNLDGVIRVGDLPALPEHTTESGDNLFATGQPSTRSKYTRRPETGVIQVGKQSALPENTVFDIGGTVTDMGDTSRLSGDIAPNTGYTFKSLAIGAGQRLTFSISNAGPEAEIKIGYVEISGTVTYVTIMGDSGSHSFIISETGTYRLYIFNSSDYNISGINLSYNISNS